MKTKVSVKPTVYRIMTDTTVYNNKNERAIRCTFLFFFDVYYVGLVDLGVDAQIIM